MSIQGLVKNVEEAAESPDVEIIGNIVMATIPNDTYEGYTETLSKFKSHFSDDDFVDTIIPRPMNMKKAFIRAIQQFNEKKTNPDGSVVEFKRMKIDGAAAGVACYGRVTLSPDGIERKFDVEQDGWVAFIDDEVRSNNPDLKSMLLQKMNLDLGPNEFRAAVSKFVGARRGFSMRQNGGMYFVPSCTDLPTTLDADCASMQQSLSAVNPKAHFVTLPVLGSPVGNSGIKQCFTQSFLGDIEQFKRETELFFSAEGKRQKGATLRRLEQVQDLRTFSLAYETILSEELEDVKDKLEELENYVESAVADELSENHSAADPNESQ